MLGFTNAKPMAPPYDGIMLKFYAIPAKTDSGTGRVRFKIEKPVDSTGVMIRYKTTAWIVGTDNETTGTLVANITDDTSYKGVNQWYEATGLPLNQDLYFCAFPYKGSAYSSVKSENLTKCRAGGLEFEYTMDSIIGNQILDTSGNDRHLTGTFSLVSGKVGNAVSLVPPNDVTLSTGLYGNGTGTVSAFIKPVYGASWEAGICSTYSSGGVGFYHMAVHTSTQCSVYTQINAPNTAASYSKNTTVPADLSVNFHNFTSAITPSALRSYYDGVLVDSVEKPFGAAQSATPICIGNVANAGGYTQYCGGYFDQVRYWNRPLEEFEIVNIARGGTGC